MTMVVVGYKYIGDVEGYKIFPSKIEVYEPIYVSDDLIFGR